MHRHLSGITPTMLSHLTASFRLLRPRALAQTSKVLEALVEESRTQKRAIKTLQERDHTIEQGVRSVGERGDTQLAELQRELRAVKAEMAALALREAQLRAVVRRDAELESAAAALPALMDTTRINEHVSAAIAGAALHTDPCPHVVVTELFPPDLYEALLLAIPPRELFEDKPVNKQQLNVPFAFAPAYSRALWKYMADVVIDRVLAPALIERFREPLRDWIVANWPSLADDPFGPPMRLHSTDGRILLRRRGYRIRPHRDPKWGFITGLLYLAGAHDRPEWGTQLFAVDADDEARGAAPHWIGDTQCRLARTVPFVRNSGLFFLNSSGAHGAHIPDDAEPASLERYAYQFRIGPTGQSIQALVAELPENRRALWAGKVVDSY
jgi:hypothetical protein